MRLGEPFNRWMYRVRRRVFAREVRRAHLPQASVLDVGAGTGFYLRQWRRMLPGADIAAIDIAPSSVALLRRDFPGFEIRQGDVSETTAGFPLGTFGAISCMDVLFHVVDDDSYRAALTNLASLLAPGGVLFYSDNFVHNAGRRDPTTIHYRNRTLEAATATLTEVGLRVERRVPMFVLMNQPVDASPRLQRLWLRVADKATRTPFGGLSGATLYPLELALVRLLREGPSTELVVARKDR